MYMVLLTDPSRICNKFTLRMVGAIKLQGYKGVLNSEMCQNLPLADKTVDSLLNSFQIV